jgi:dethiobiotin synthetase
MSKGFFITGTDTDVGKTLIAGALIKLINYLGYKVCGMKPIESGCGREGDVLIPYDGMFLKQIAHLDEPINMLTPCCLESPLAPLPASEIDQIEINLNQIRKSYARLTRDYEKIVVEGIGGLLVPILHDYSVVDLAKEFGLPLIVVAKPGLGTINHILLTVNYALKEGLEVAGVILNYSYPPEDNLAEETNPQLLKQICPAPLLGTFPYLKRTEEEEITKTALNNFDLAVIQKYLQSND